jgi:hypothetical protein
VYTFLWHNIHAQLYKYCKEFEQQWCLQLVELVVKRCTHALQLGVVGAAAFQMKDILH